MADMTYVDLVMEGGELVCIECPVIYEDQLHNYLSNELKIGGTWSPARFDGCKAEYLGMSLSRVNMKKVVAML